MWNRAWEQCLVFRWRWEWGVARTISAVSLCAHEKGPPSAVCRETKARLLTLFAGWDLENQGLCEQLELASERLLESFEYAWFPFSGQSQFLSGVRNFWGDEDFWRQKNFCGRIKLLLAPFWRGGLASMIESRATIFRYGRGARTKAQRTLFDLGAWFTFESSERQKHNYL